MNPDTLGIPLDSLERELIEQSDPAVYAAAQIMADVEYGTERHPHSFGLSITLRMALALREHGYLPTPLDEVEVSPARHTDPSTSKAAALTLTPETAYGKLALTYYQEDRRDHRHGRPLPERGLTAEEAVNIAQLPGRSPWKRCSELRQAGIIEPTGYTIKGSSGRQQQLLAITEHGKREVERLLLGAS